MHLQGGGGGSLQGGTKPLSNLSKTFGLETGNSHMDAPPLQASVYYTDPKWEREALEKSKYSEAYESTGTTCKKRWVKRAAVSSKEVRVIDESASPPRHPTCPNPYLSLWEWAACLCMYGNYYGQNWQKLPIYVCHGLIWKSCRKVECSAQAHSVTQKGENTHRREWPHRSVTDRLDYCKVQGDRWLSSYGLCNRTMHPVRFLGSEHYIAFVIQKRQLCCRNIPFQCWEIITPG